MSAVMPEWYDGKKINEVMFCDAFLEEYPMKCIRGQFFTVDGLVDDENMIRMEIYNRIKPFVTSSVAKKATQLMEALKLACYLYFCRGACGREDSPHAPLLCSHHRRWAAQRKGDHRQQETADSVAG